MKNNISFLNLAKFVSHHLMASQGHFHGHHFSPQINFLSGLFEVLSGGHSHLASLNAHRTAAPPCSWYLNSFYSDTVCSWGSFNCCKDVQTGFMLRSLQCPSKLKFIKLLNRQFIGTDWINRSWPHMRVIERTFNSKLSYAEVLIYRQLK